MSEEETERNGKLARQWTLLEQHRQTGRPIIARVVEATHTLIIVDIDGIRGIVEQPTYAITIRLVPGESEEERLQQVEEHLARQLTYMVGQQLRLKVLEVDPERNRLTLSQRLYNDGTRQVRRPHQQPNLQPGSIVHGKVTAISEQAVSLDVQGFIGAIPHKYLDRPDIEEKPIKIGLELEAMILNKESEGILTLSCLHARLRNEMLSQLAEGKEYVGQIVSIIDEGVYIDLNGPLGFLATSKIVRGYITHPADLFHNGQSLRVCIEEITPERRIHVSLREEL